MSVVSHGWTKDRLWGLDEMALLQCLIWGEARSEPIDGMAAVANVVGNRVDNPGWWGETWHEVCLHPMQFSCFNNGDPNLKKILDQYATLRYADELWKLCKWVAGGVIYRWIPDNTKGSDHYCHINLNPHWAQGRTPVKIIGHHKFYKLRKE